MKHMAEESSEYTLYVLDSSGWISIDGRADHAKILWHMLQLVERGQVKSPPEVWDELVRCHNVLAWIGEFRSKIVLAVTDPAYFAIIGQNRVSVPADVRHTRF